MGETHIEYRPWKFTQGVTALGTIPWSLARLVVTGQAAFTALPGSLGGGGIGLTITESQTTNPVGLNGYLRIGRGQAVVTRNAINTGDHILLSSNATTTDDTCLGILRPTSMARRSD